MPTHRSYALRSIVALPALAALAVAPPAAAQTARATTEADGYGYIFKDDAMRAGGFGPKDPRIHVVPHAERSLLIRPRTQFIAEMLKSVENL